MIVAQICPFIL